MKFVFFRFRRTEKVDSVMKGLLRSMPSQNFWARVEPPLLLLLLIIIITMSSVCAVTN